MKTAMEELFEKYGHLLPNVEKDFIEKESNYIEQQCDLIRNLYTKPTIQLKPLEDLWREENPRDKFTIPDATAFYKWIRIKILGK